MSEKQHSRFLKEGDKLVICRVCLEGHEKTMSIFEPYKDSTICHQIVTITDIKISPGDGFPDRICLDCFTELETAINFKEKCNKSDRQLHKNLSIEVASIKKEEPEEYEIHVECVWDGEDVDSHETEQKFLSSKVFVDSPGIKTEESKPKRDIQPPEKNLQCNDCSKMFSSKCKLSVHWKQVHLPQTYMCEICRRVFKCLEAYNKHKNLKTKGCAAVEMEGVRVEGVGKSRMFYCSFCDYKSEQINSIRSHAVTHNGKRPYACNLCPNTYTQRCSLMNHKEKVHSEYKIEITCNFCGKYVRGRDRVYRHLSSHSTQKLQCDICKKYLKNKKSLTDHLDRHTGIKKNMCDICGAAYYSKMDLHIHKKFKHSSLPLIQCQFCGYKSNKKWIVEKHEKRHTDSNFACPAPRCGKFFQSEQRLKNHEKRHIFGRVKKIYTCDLCGEQFKRKKSWVTHVKNKHDAPVNDVAKIEVKLENPAQ